MPPHLIHQFRESNRKIHIGCTGFLDFAALSCCCCWDVARGNAVVRIVIAVVGIADAVVYDDAVGDGDAVVVRENVVDNSGDYVVGGGDGNSWSSCGCFILVIGTQCCGFMIWAIGGGSHGLIGCRTDNCNAFSSTFIRDNHIHDASVSTTV